MALYGASPFYIFGILPIEKSLIVFASALISTIMYWAFNSYLFFYSKLEKKWLIYLLSYFFAYFSNIFKFFMGINVNEVRVNFLDYIIYPLITVLALNTIILIIINSVIHEEKKIEADKKITALSLENLKAQKQTLTQQLQPHFLFNALSILKSLIQDDKSLAEKYIVQLSDFLRYSVDSHNNDLVSIESELKFVTDYMELQKIRFGESFSFHLNVDKDILDKKVPVLAIQTLAENAFKHNYFTQKNPMQVKIMNNSSTLTVSNNITSIKLTERNGTGLENLKKRYQLFGVNEVRIEQTEHTFSVTIPILDV